MPVRGPAAGGGRAGGWRLWSLLPLLLLPLLPEEAWPAAIRDEVALAWALLPALWTAGFAWAFARTLRPGREPLIARYTRFDPRRDPAECAGYARGLTLFWAVALGLVSVVEFLALWAGFDLGLWPEAAILALFLGEHVVRSIRFPSGGIAWPTQTLAAILRAERAHHG
ncbi:hypothetical protein J8J14_08325 [Roseomonas sp. SSH11]|uniref:Uncharacterized protein n=1 Tax=Pararoseomonas baculiformis TaxID=2820812 RepID=A0ABS4AEV9_9PROT|nr:hypothetical protein [Pararoseomonas baculiformis]MBP0444789.1 hypothetical protein [Pararoseomonas baculiformis]